MMRLYLLICVFLFGCSSLDELNPNDHIFGKWSLTEKGEDYEKDKLCEFFISGKLNCINSEAGFSEGYGDAHSYKSVGNWSIKNNVLTLIEIPTYNVKQKLTTQYRFKSFTVDRMALINNKGVAHIWFKTK